MKSLFDAIKHGDIRKIIQIVENNPGVVNSVAKAQPKLDAGKSPLQIAVQYKQIDIANYLLDKGADVNFVEADKGLPWTQHRRMPVLSFTIVRLYSFIRDFNEYENWEKYKNLILHMLTLGADTNQKDNWNASAWMHTIFSYSEVMWSEKDTNKITLIKRITKSILDMLIQHGSDIYFIGAGDYLSNYRKFIVNMIFNQELCDGIAESEREVWKQRWESISTLLKLYYVKDNPYYGCEVSIDRKKYFEQILTTYYEVDGRKNI